MPRILLTIAILIAATMSFDSATAFEIKNRFAIAPFGGVSIPIGDFANSDSANIDAKGAKTGFVLGASVEYGVTENIALGGRFAYRRFGVDREVFGAEVPDSSGFDGDWSIVELFGAYVKYVAMPGKSTRPYARGGLFIGKPKLSVEYDTVDLEYEGDVAFGVEAAVGVTHMFSKRFGASIEGRFANLFSTGSIATTDESPLAAHVRSPAGIRDPGGNLVLLDVQSSVVFLVD